MYINYSVQGESRDSKLFTLEFSEEENEIFSNFVTTIFSGLFFNFNDAVTQLSL